MGHTFSGLHHVTATCGSAQTNHAFVTGTLGQKLVKRTVNFDAPRLYHLYYGDRIGTPGSVTTWFADPDAAPGQTGPGMASALAWETAPETLTLWADRLPQARREDRFGLPVLRAQDPDGLAVELVATPGAPEIPVRLHSVTLWVADPLPTARFLTGVLGLTETGGEGHGFDERRRFAIGDSGQYIDLLDAPANGAGRGGAGTIHHIAFRAESADEQMEWADRLASAGLEPTEVRDRSYFRSIYFREPGGCLFEIATDGPGFTVDEPVGRLGEGLMLPLHHASLRRELEESLPPLTA
ncbi:MAG: VOC family protein [Paracoccaceae bacterium]